VKNLTRSLLVMVAVVSFFGSLQPDKAFAQTPCPGAPPGTPWGRLENCGYFLNQFVDASGVGLLTGIGSPWGNALLGANDIDSFVGIIRWHLQGDCIPDSASAIDGQRRNAAAFIVLTMLGAPPGGGGWGAAEPCRPGSPYHVDVWDNRVRQYASRGLIDFNRTLPYGINTRVQRITQDIAWYGDVDSQPSIVFRSPGGAVLYQIKRNCANPVGIPSALPNLDTPSTINCGSVQLSPTVPQPGEDFSITASFTTSGGTPPGQLEFYTVHISLNGPVGSTGRFTDRLGSAFGQAARSGGSGSGTVPGLFSPAPPISIPTAGTYSGSYRVTMNGASNSPRTCPYTVTVVSLPYSRVFGGDVFAGAGFGTPCYDPSARVIGWNRSNYLAFGLAVGSGTQLAVSALNGVTDFASGQVRNNINPAVNSISNLTFANTGGGYGGNLDQTNAVCAPDYWADRGGGPVPAVINPSHNGKFSHSGSDLTLNVNPVGIGRTGTTGNHVSIYVEGQDVYISNNINYQFTSYNNLQEMASFRLVVHGGNIYIAPGVTTLNGLFVAIPTNASNGRVYTCSNGFAPPTLAQLNNAGAGGCRQNRLTVYGSIVADLIKFTRTLGTLNNAGPADRYNSPGNPAELIINTPDTWLTSGFNGGEGYNAITTLPPVL
jgi:hypothetical protein